MEQRQWKEHNDIAGAQNLQPSAPLARLFESLPDTRRFYAADLGCGAGTDTLAMLQRGWNVLAIDKDAESAGRLKGWKSDKLKVNVQSFEKLNLPPLDLVNASMALPFCEPAYFHHCWETICSSLSPQKGYFCGHFFGPNDSWATRSGMTFLHRDTLMTLFKDFTIRWFDETEQDGKTLAGSSKHWHLFSIVARKL